MITIDFQYKMELVLKNYSKLNVLFQLIWLFFFFCEIGFILFTYLCINKNKWRVITVKDNFTNFILWSGCTSYLTIFRFYYHVNIKYYNVFKNMDSYLLR